MKQNLFILFFATLTLTGCKVIFTSEDPKAPWSCAMPLATCPPGERCAPMPCEPEISIQFNRIDGFFATGHAEPGVPSGSGTSQPSTVSTSPLSDMPCYAGPADETQPAGSLPNCPPPCDRSLAGATGCPPPPPISDFGIFGAGSVSFSDTSPRPLGGEAISQPLSLPVAETKLTVRFDGLRYSECRAKAEEAQRENTRLHISGRGQATRDSSSDQTQVTYYVVTRCEVEKRPEVALEVSLKDVTEVHMLVPPTPGMPCYLDPDTGVARCPDTANIPRYVHVRGHLPAETSTTDAPEAILSWAAADTISDNCYNLANEAKATQKGLKVSGTAVISDETPVQLQSMVPQPRTFAFKKILKCEIQ